MKQKLKNTKGITLVALIITIIVLLILAVVAITSISNSNIIKHAQNGSAAYAKAQKDEADMLLGYEKLLGKNSDEKYKIKDYIGKIVNPNANIELTDDFGNSLVLPAGFRIVVDDTTDYTEENVDITKGIVIEDEDANQFVWIPVGTLYLDKSHSNSVNIALGRYSSLSYGNYSYITTGELINGENTEYEVKAGEDNSNYAKNISDFKNKVNTSKGYYIGRYEARGGKILNNDSNVWNTSFGSAVEASRTIYNSEKFDTDLMNSYAWDTAVVFIQEFGDRNYADKKGITFDGDFASKGLSILKSTGEVDKQLNIYDMAGNIGEWTTEKTNNKDYGPYVWRGGMYWNDEDNDYTVGGRTRGKTSDNRGFRPVLYLLPTEDVDPSPTEPITEEIYHDMGENNTFSLKSNGKGNISETIYFSYDENNVMTFDGDFAETFSGRFEKANVNGQEVRIFFIKNIEANQDLKFLTIKKGNWTNFKGLDNETFTGNDGIVAEFKDGKMTITQNNQALEGLENVEYVYYNGVLNYNSSEYQFNIDYSNKKIEVISLE